MFPHLFQKSLEQIKDDVKCYKNRMESNCPDGMDYFEL